MTYEYRCEACDHEWEQQQRITEESQKDCPRCGLSRAKRQISSGNFVLKGSGWYRDGYGPSVG